MRFKRRYVLIFMRRLAAFFNIYLLIIIFKDSSEGLLRCNEKGLCPLRHSEQNKSSFTSERLLRMRVPTKFPSVAGTCVWSVLRKISNVKGECLRIANPPKVQKFFLRRISLLYRLFYFNLLIKYPLNIKKFSRVMFTREMP